MCCGWWSRSVPASCCLTVWAKICSRSTPLISNVLDEFVLRLMSWVGFLFPSSLEELFSTARGESGKWVGFHNRNLSHALFTKDLFTPFTSLSTTPSSFYLLTYPFQWTFSYAASYGFVLNIPASLNHTHSVITPPLPPYAQLISHSLSVSSVRGSDGPQGVGLSEGPCRAEFGEIRRRPNGRPRPRLYDVVVWFSRSFHDAGGEGKHDGA